MGQNNSSESFSAPDGNDIFSNPEKLNHLGLHVLKVAENSPAASAGLDPMFDYIVGINNEPVFNIDGSTGQIGMLNLRQVLASAVNTQVTLNVFSTKLQTTRELQVTPSTGWANPEDGIIGCHVKQCSYSRANEHVWRVLDIQPGSPAFTAGLIPYTDYIIGTPHMTLRQQDDFYVLVERHVGSPLTLFIYNTHLGFVRRVVVVPKNDWGGVGLLGANIGYGYLHRLPVISTDDQGPGTATKPVTIIAESASRSPKIQPRAVANDHKTSSPKYGLQQGSPRSGINPFKYQDENARPNVSESVQLVHKDNTSDPLPQAFKENQTHDPPTSVLIGPNPLLNDALPTVSSHSSTSAKSHDNERISSPITGLPSLASLKPQYHNVPDSGALYPIKQPQAEGRGMQNKPSKSETSASIQSAVNIAIDPAFNQSPSSTSLSPEAALRKPSVMPISFASVQQLQSSGPVESGPADRNVSPVTSKRHSTASEFSGNPALNLHNAPTGILDVFDTQNKSREAPPLSPQAQDFAKQLAPYESRDVLHTGSDTSLSLNSSRTSFDRDKSVVRSPLVYENKSGLGVRQEQNRGSASFSYENQEPFPVASGAAAGYILSVPTARPELPTAIVSNVASTIEPDSVSAVSPVSSGSQNGTRRSVDIVSKSPVYQNSTSFIHTHETESSVLAAFEASANARKSFGLAPTGATGENYFERKLADNRSLNSHNNQISDTRSVDSSGYSVSVTNPPDSNIPAHSTHEVYSQPTEFNATVTNFDSAAVGTNRPLAGFSNFAAENLSMPANGAELIQIARTRQSQSPPNDLFESIDLNKEHEGSSLPIESTGQAIQLDTAAEYPLPQFSDNGQGAFTSALREPPSPKALVLENPIHDSSQPSDLKEALNAPRSTSPINAQQTVPQIPDFPAASSLFDNGPVFSPVSRSFSNELYDSFK